jgi:BirA family biotin operon repressor/biotin-[acetyl-CoA-carboxylase] ligase
MDPRISLALRRRAHESVPAAVLAAETGLSPAQVAAAVDEMCREGFVVEAHPLLGYRLIATPPALAADEIRWGLDARRIGRTVRCVDETPSTNDLAWDAAADGPAEADGLAVFAESQAAGRGRRGNRWLAPPHSSLLVSVLVWTPGAAGAAAMLTRGAALAAAEAIEAATGLDAGIKWPNDVVVEDRKVGGILVEARPAAGGAAAPAVVGIGLNCLQTAEDFPPDVRPHAAGLAMFADPLDRTLLARGLLERLDAAVARMGDAEGLLGLEEEASRRCRTLGRPLAVEEGGATFRGRVVGLDPDYGLLLRLPEGAIRRFAAMTTHVLPASEA